VKDDGVKVIVAPPSRGEAVTLVGGSGRPRNAAKAPRAAAPDSVGWKEAPGRG
jgi:hypothetical protein